ncbi:hypothetical protein G9444_3097 [Rhodococcus erythropolis]|uniref:Uncharacterized protein n=1 Tax=Rhodococcus erythropolis TaxID=1833 RepID=A0A6G9CU34_RHOER|nr:hypothetical protein G9444_3097 [Rhodococcus erythropolis]
MAIPMIRAGDGGQHEVALSEQMHRNHRFVGTLLDEDKSHCRHDAADDQPDDDGRSPGVGVSAPGREQDQTRRCRRDENHAQIVDARLAEVRLPQVQKCHRARDGE